MSKKKHSTPNIPASTILRLRLEGLWQNPSLPIQSIEQIEGDLQTLTRGIKPDQFIVAVLSTFLGAPPLARDHLEKILPNWLTRQNYLDSLQGIDTLLNRNLEELSVKAQACICENFSLQQLGERTLQALRQLCAA